MVGILWYYQYMLVVYLCLCGCILSTLCLHGFLIHRNFRFGLGKIIIPHIHYMYQSMVLIVVVLCLLLPWVLLLIFSVFFSILTSYDCLDFLDVALWGLFCSWVGSCLRLIYPLQSQQEYNTINTYIMPIIPLPPMVLHHLTISTNMVPS